MLRVGSEAPDFEAVTAAGQTFRLSALRGHKPTVLYFFPKAFTAGWTREARGFRDAFEAITAAGAALVGISPDSVETLATFAQAHDLPFDLIPDPSQRIIRLYETRRRFGLGVSRITYVVDRAGTIAGTFHHEVRIGGHGAEVLSTLSTD